LAANAFLEEALARLIEKGVVEQKGDKLSFTQEWATFLATRVSYSQKREQIKQKIIEALSEFYRQKGYDGETRFDLAWVKQIFVAQFALLTKEERELINEFIKGVNLIDV
jgi:hypothetical protein